MAWLFLVFVLTSSYTASLTSRLTVPLLEPKVKDIEWVRKSNSPIGCDRDSFVYDYLVNVLDFKSDNIINVSSQYLYHELFSNGTIVAAFLELPYEKVFLDQYCKSFTHTKETFRFGGQGFVFQKGSPIATDVSKAILSLSENGVLKELNDKWFPTSPMCSTSTNEHDVERLNTEGFLGLYIIYGVISAICSFFFFFFSPRVRSYIRNYRSYNATITLGSSSFSSRVIEILQYFQRGETTDYSESSSAPKIAELPVLRTFERSTSRPPH